MPQSLSTECSTFSTPRQRFTFVHLLYPYLLNSWFNVSLSLSTMALYHSTIRWFETRSCKPVSTGLPPSQLQHAMIFSRSLLLGTRMNSCRRPVTILPGISFLNLSSILELTYCRAIIYAECCAACLFLVVVISATVNYKFFPLYLVN